MNKLVTIANPKNLAREKEFVLVTRREYDNLVRARSRAVPEVKLTPAQRRAIAASERELKRSAYLTLNELRHELARAHTKARK